MSSCLESCELHNTEHVCLKEKTVVLRCGEPISYTEHTYIPDTCKGNVNCHTTEFFTWHCKDCYEHQSSDCKKSVRFTQAESHHSFTEASFYCGAPSTSFSAIQLHSDMYGVLKVRVDLSFAWKCVVCSKRNAFDFSNFQN